MDFIIYGPIKLWFWKTFYNLIAKYIPVDHLTLLNYGYASLTEEDGIFLKEDREHQWIFSL